MGNGMGMNKTLNKVGIFGGTFDPIHTGHLLAAQEAAFKLELEEIWFMPTGEPWLKEGNTVSSAENRLAMLELAIGNNNIFKSCSIEMNIPGPSYTVETLGQISKAGYLGKPFFIIGRDSLDTLPHWHEPALLFDLCNLVVINRPTHLNINMDSIEKIKPGSSRDITFLDSLKVDISGTEIRRRVSEHNPITYWVPDGVERYIYENNLYRE